VENYIIQNLMKRMVGGQPNSWVNKHF